MAAPFPLPPNASPQLTALYERANADGASQSDVDAFVRARGQALGYPPEYIDQQVAQTAGQSRNAQASADQQGAAASDAQRRSDAGMSSDFDESIAGIPLLDQFSGAEGRRAAAREAKRQREEQSAIGSFESQLPTVDDLSVDYGQLGTEDEYGNLLGGPSAFAESHTDPYAREAMSRMARMGAGEMTAGDSAAYQMSRQNQMGLLRGANDAALQQMSARGTVGSGNELAARLAGSEQAQQGQANLDAQTQQMLAMRALQANAGMGALGMQQGSQEQQRRAQLDAFNQQQLGFRRGREAANVGLQAQTGESRARANQQASQNRENVASLKLGQYGGARSADAQGRSANARDNQATGGFISGLFDEFGL